MAGLMVTAFAVGMVSTAASAKTCVWTGLGTPDPTLGNELMWTDAGNWKDGNVPMDGDTVVFVEQASLSWNGSGTLVLKDGASTSAGTLAVAGGKVVLDGDVDEDRPDAPSPLKT